MRAHFERSRHLRHLVSRGGAREELLRDFLIRDAGLPRRYGITTGAVFGRNGEVSAQCDLIVFDALTCPTLAFNEKITYVPSEGTYAVIEVKSQLDKKALGESFGVTKSVRSAADNVPLQRPPDLRYPDRVPGRPYCVVFAYRNAYRSFEKAVEAIKAMQRLRWHETPDVIVLLDQGIVHKSNLVFPLPPGDDDEERMMGQGFGTRTLFECYSMLTSMFSDRNIAEVNLMDYAIRRQHENRPEQS
jgi:hypothetical protein